MSELQDVLTQALARESQSYIKCIFFAKKAQKEGYEQIAKLFRTASEIERIQANNHLRALDTTRATPENVVALLNQKIDEMKEVYPPMIETAKGYENKWAVKSLCYAEESAKALAKFLKKNMDNIQQAVEADYYVCKACGFAVENELPEKCPVCGSRKETFKRMD